MVLATALFIYLHMMRVPHEALEKGAKLLSQVVKDIHSGSMVNEFRNNNIRIKGTNKLEVATG